MGNCLHTAKCQQDFITTENLNKFLPFNFNSNHDEFNINPGTAEDIHKDCREILARPFQGGQIILNKYLNENLLILHTINLSPNMSKGSYKFGVTYNGNSINTNEGNFPLLQGNIETNGNMDSNITHYLNQRLRIKFCAEYIGKILDCCQLSFDYFGNNFTSSFGIADLNILQNSGVIIGQYLQSITKNFALGSEMGYQLDNLNMHDHKFLFNFISKYQNDDTTFSTSIGPNGICVSYTKIASTQLKIATQFTSDLQTIDKTYATIGYEVDIPRANLLFRASIDSKFNICSVLQKNLRPVPFAAFTISTKLNQKTGQFGIGCGVVVA